MSHDLFKDLFSSCTFTYISSANTVNINKYGKHSFRSRKEEVSEVPAHNCHTNLHTKNLAQCTAILTLVTQKHLLFEKL